MSDKDTHTYLEVNGDFRMRELDHNDLEQFNALLQYAFQVTSYELFQTGWEQEEIKYAKRPILEDAYVLGWFYKEKLASMIVVYSMQINIQDNIMAMGGITGVTTYPEYTGRGLIHSLMRYVIDYMHKKKLPISFLYPYSIPFYRKMGWEIVSDKLTFTVKDTQLPKAFPVRGMVERVSLDSEDFHNVYSYFAMQHHGALIRDKLAWDEYWRWENDDMIVALYYNEEHKPLGYLVYYIANEIFHIKDMIFNNEEARTGLWNFVSAHFSMIDQVEGDTYTDEPLAFLLEDASIKEVISPYYMGRIVDFPAFISRYPFKPDITDREWKFTLTDPIMECNQGTFLLEISRDGHGEVTRISEKCEDVISIQTMTTMLMGYKRPDYLAKIGRLQANGSVIDMLEDAIEQQVPYISDYF